MSDPRPAPYPADTRAKGWRFELDYEKIDQSDTWGLADTLPLAKPCLLMMWLVAWKQEPCGSLPNDEQVIMARCQIPPTTWAKLRNVLMRGWWLADDGRLYHDTLVKRAIEMMAKRRSDSDRQAAKRARDALESGGTPAGVPPESRVTSPELGVESSTDHRPPTEAKASVKGRKRAPPPDSVSAEVLIAAGFDGETAAEFIACKASRKAPLTPRAWADHLREAEKAGWSPVAAAEKVMAKTWKGFEAKYVADEPKPGARTMPFKTAKQIDQEAIQKRVFESTGGLLGRPAQQPQGDFIDMQAIERIA